VQAVKVVSGRAAPLDRSDVDTDQIIPARWLKRIKRSGFGAGLFEAWRKEPDFVLNDERYNGAAILVAGANFGCGSSREHAPWALEDYGFRAVVAPSFADIFRNNCYNIGLVAAPIDAAANAKLMAALQTDPELQVVVDVETKRVICEGAGVDTPFILDDHTQHRLLNGLDDIALTLQERELIDTYEASRAKWMPKVAIAKKPRP
jgi:3-isopropylmalate/(R)-2-methylmalate dehydratase small subunit